MVQDRAIGLLCPELDEMGTQAKSKRMVVVGVLLPQPPHKYSSFSAIAYKGSSSSKQRGEGEAHSEGVEGECEHGCRA